MERLLYLLVISACMMVAVYIYKDEIKILLPWDKIKQKRKDLKKSVAVLIVRRNKSSMDKEIFSSSIILKNLSLVRQEAPISADYIYEKLMENSNRLRPIYEEMLTLYRNGYDDEAFKFMAMEIGTKPAKNFANILSKLDKINPAELVSQMDMFQESMSESSMTLALNKAQRNSTIAMVLAAASIFALLINFTVVVVFMNTIEILNDLFL